MKNNYLNSLFVLIIGLGILNSGSAFGQAVSINSTGNPPDAQSILDITSTTKGVLLPRVADHTTITPTNGSDNGLMVFNTTTDTYWYWDASANAWREIPNTTTIPTVSLDDAYNGGIFITADAGAVQITGTTGAISLDVDQAIRVDEDEWIGLGSTIERIEFDGSQDRIDFEDADLTIDDGKWIGIDASSPRIEYTDGAPGILDIDDANVRVENNTWFGLGSTTERFVFQGSDNEVNLMGAEFGIGTLAPTVELDVNGQIRMRTGATANFIPVGDANGVMTWTDPATLDATTASNGIYKDVNDIKLGTNPLTEATTITQGAFTMDFTTTATDGFSVDGTTFSVDGANDRIGIGTSAPSHPFHILSAATDIARIQGTTHARLYVDGTDGSEKTVMFSEGGVSQWQVGMDNTNAGGGSSNDFIVKQTNNGTPEFTVQAASGNVGIGTSVPSQRLQINVDNAGFNLPIFVRNTDGTAGNEVGIGFVNEAAGNWAKGAIVHERAANFGRGNMHFLLDNTADNSDVTMADSKMTILGNGNVGIGDINPGTKLAVAGDVTITGKFNSNGIQESSDKRFKKNITPLTKSLDKLKQVEGVSYNWRVEEFPKRKFGSSTEIGLIAQDLEKVFPELVSTDKDGYKSVQYSHLVPVLVEAIKEQQKQIEMLIGANEAMQGQYSDLKEYLGQIERNNK